MTRGLRTSFLLRSFSLVPVLLAASDLLWARPHPAPGTSLPGLLPGAAPGSSAPWNIVLLLTLLTLIPAIVPLDAGQINMMAALDRSIIPMRRFMLKYAREKDLALFVELAHETRPARPEDLGMRIVAPAYLLSELQAGFRIGAALFLPFLVIDLVTAAITTSIGMMQLPPVIISTPLKILLFVVVDGWNLLIGSLMRSFA